jgi:hypothetical protein
MKIKYRQKSAGWCTVYALANMFQDSRFLKFTEEERFKGCSKEEVDFMLHDLGYNLALGWVMYGNQHYNRFPKGYVYSALRSFKEQFPENFEVRVPVIPYLLSVRLVPEMWHSVVVLMAGDDMFYIDPYKEERLLIESFEQFDALFIDCQAVERPYVIPDNAFCVLRGEDLGFNQPELIIN